jgi:hypothetical protein
MFRFLGLGINERPLARIDISVSDRLHDDRFIT